MVLKEFGDIENFIHLNLLEGYQFVLDHNIHTIVQNDSYKTAKYKISCNDRLIYIFNEIKIIDDEYAELVFGMNIYNFLYKPNRKSKILNIID